MTLRTLLIKVRSELRNTLWLIMDSLVSLQPRARTNACLILVRLDAIGDLVLWLDAARHYRSLYPNKRIVLVANSTCVGLASFIPFWDEVLPIDIHRLRVSPSYRLRTLGTIRGLGSDLIVHPTYSRTLLDGDAVVRASGAPERIGCLGDHSNISPRWKRISDKWYTRLVPVPKDSRMEIERNTDFMLALGAKVVPELTSIPPLLPLKTTLQETSPYFVVFPGASWVGRQWPTSHFAEVIRQTVARTGWRPIICGGPGDIATCKSVADAAGCSQLRNLAGSTSLAELVEVLRGAELLFANETSAVHLAAAVNTPTVCVLGGGHFGRFAPYPKYLDGQLPIFVSHQMECFNCNWNCIYPRAQSECVPCIASIGISEVMRLADEIITLKSSINKLGAYEGSK